MPGVDLEAKAVDVARIAASLYGRKVIDAGFEWDDFLSNLYMAILRRNEGNTPYDPRRASLSRYISVLSRTVLSHMCTARWRLERKHSLGARDRSGAVVDAALVAVELQAPQLQRSVEAEAADLLRAQLVSKRLHKAAVLVLVGHKTREVAEACGMTREVVSWLREELRNAYQDNR